MDNSKPGLNDGVISLGFSDDRVLYSAYMPFIADGGLFVPGTDTERYQLGDEVHVSLQLAGEAGQLAILGKVVWVTPADAEGNRKQGVGVQFIGKNRAQIKSLIEARLSGKLDSQVDTYTM